MPWLNIPFITVLLVTLIILIIWLVITLIFAGTMIFGAPYVASRDDKLKTILQLIKDEFVIKKTPPKSSSLAKPVLSQVEGRRTSPSFIKEGETGGVKSESRVKIADLGFGNGKILIAIAQLASEAAFDAELHGYEINPLLVWLSRWNAWKFHKTFQAVPSSLPNASPELVEGRRDREEFNNEAMKQLNNITIFNHSFFSVDLSSYHLITLYATTYVMKPLEKKLLKELKPGSIVISNYFRFPNWKSTKSINQVHLYCKK
jgi:hypothetical protein